MMTPTKLTNPLIMRKPVRKPMGRKNRIIRPRPQNNVLSLKTY